MAAGQIIRRVVSDARLAPGVFVGKELLRQVYTHRLVLLHELRTEHGVAKHHELRRTEVQADALRVGGMVDPGDDRGRRV